MAHSIEIDCPACGEEALLRIEEGRLTGVTPTAARCDLDYELAPEPFLRVVSGTVPPQSLFFAQEVKVGGPLVQGLATATALEEFFRLFPFIPERARTGQPISSHRKAAV